MQTDIVRYRPEHTYTAKLKVTTENKVGVLSDVLSIFTREGVDVVFVNTNAIDKTFAIIDLEIEVNNQEHIDLLISKVNAKKFISKCERHINETE